MKKFNDKIKNNIAKLESIITRIDKAQDLLYKATKEHEKEMLRIELK